MSRLIVKNLPLKVDPEKLRVKFSERGPVTDLQLRYTKEGKFRKFAFIGYKTEEEAKAAIDHFNETFIDTCKILVEPCASLGSLEKPKAWSKHSRDKSSLELDQHGDETKSKSEKDEKKKKKKNIDPELLGKIEKHKDEPEFREFLQVHGNSERFLNLQNNDSVVEECEKSYEDEAEKTVVQTESAALAPISDAEYLKLKTKGANAETFQNLPTQPTESPDTKKSKIFFTLKIKNLPKKVKKTEIKEFLKPLVPASVRRARGLLGIAYVGFKTEKEVKKALIKNKSFLKGKQVLVSECKEKSMREESDEGTASRWKQQEEVLKEEESIGESGMIFLRNLCYSAKEEEIEQLFSKYGPLSEVLLPIDKLTRKTKGYGTVTFLIPEHAVAAYSDLDGSIFQGRMLHLLPAKAKKVEEQVSDKSTNYKEIKKATLKKTAGHSHNWNTLFLGQNAVAEIIADTYKTGKHDILTGREAAVRLALGETQIVDSTKEFLTRNGVRLDAFNSKVEKRSKNIILVKNLPAKTTCQEIREMFEKTGLLGRVVLPPSGITAIVEFEESVEARAAFTKLAYIKFKNLPLYLEWAPDNTFLKEKQPVGEENQGESPDTIEQEAKEESSDDEAEPEPDTTIFVKNLNFNTTEDNLKNHFSPCGKLANASVSRKKDPKNPGKMLSMGYGFVQFYLRSSLNKALIELQGSELGGHSLELKRSNRTVQPDPSVGRRATPNLEKQTSKKILVRNIPFQADAKEITQLFKTFGDLKCVRLPKKMVGTGSHRGFAFVEYVTKHEAKLAMKALCQSTHLYGRRLVLEWAKMEEDVETIRKRTASHFPSNLPEKGSKKATADLMGGDDGDEDELD